jgi:hypothetical protein
MNEERAGKCLRQVGALLDPVILSNIVTVVDSEDIYA